MHKKILLSEDWLIYLQSLFETQTMSELRTFLINENKSGQDLYPHHTKVFEAFNQAPWEKTRVVIIGQDPYHGPDQAHGLCFSVPPEISIPPSLVNIYKELHNDLNIKPPLNGDLSCWAQQGVLLLNSVLTVRKHQPASHQGKGWEYFTDQVIHIINEKKNNVVFILWGSYAQKKGKIIDQNKHLVIQNVHPSPLSAYRGFFGSKPFSKTNQYLIKTNQKPIHWSCQS